MPYVLKHSIASGLVLALCITFFIQSLSYPATAARLPQILIIIIAILAVIMFLDAIRKQKKADKANEKVEKTEQINVKQVLVFGILIVLYVVLLEPIGYFILTPIFTFAALMYLKATHIGIAAAISIGFTAIIYGLFSVFLNVPIPKGMFF